VCLPCHVFVGEIHCVILKAMQRRLFFQCDLIEAISKWCVMEVCHGGVPQRRNTWYLVGRVKLHWQHHWCTHFAYVHTYFAGVTWKAQGFRPANLHPLIPKPRHHFSVHCTFDHFSRLKKYSILSFAILN
jgi:hypothetical protein